MTKPQRHLLALFILIFVVGGAPTSLRAQSCPAPPLFDLSGPACSTNRQGVACACAECVEWDAASGATWYEVRRCDAAGANCSMVGDTRWRNHAAYTDGGGVFHPEVIAKVWCVAWDDPFPAFATGYTYSIRSCKNGASGPVCAAAFSNSVAYATAPYMCIENDVEVPCSTSTPPSSPAMADLDSDGITDATDLDDDGDGITDALDTCPQVRNIGQRDVDADGIGDACDASPLLADSLGADADDDGVADRADDCPAIYDPLQADADKDRTGDACDNCPVDYNVAQSDADGDLQGDRCDLDDATIYEVWNSRTQLTWAKEDGFSSWDVYRGDLAELRETGSYSQTPGSNPLAARFCGLSVLVLDDATIPAPGTVAYYLVGGRPGSWSSELGRDSDDVVRANENACP